jgi:hypothetical protein
VDPGRLSRQFRGELAGVRSARNGDHRTLFGLDDASSSVQIISVRHRAQRVPARLSSSRGP